MYEIRYSKLLSSAHKEIVERIKYSIAFEYAWLRNDTSRFLEPQVSLTYLKAVLRRKHGAFADRLIATYY